MKMKPFSPKNLKFLRPKHASFQLSLCFTAAGGHVIRQSQSRSEVLTRPLEINSIFMGKSDSRPSSSHFKIIFHFERSDAKGRNAVNNLSCFFYCVRFKLGFLSFGSFYNLGSWRIIIAAVQLK